MFRLVLFVCFLWMISPVSAQDGSTELEVLTVDGLERTYALHVPAELTEPAPVVLVLHGRTGTGAGMERYTGFSDLADSEGFIVVYPDGINGEWNYVKDVPGYPFTHDDTAFLNAVIDQIAQEYPVDPERLYITGFSNGGFMAQRIACETPDRFAAFASVAAAAFGGMLDVCLERGTHTAPMLLIHGSQDNNIPWGGLSATRGERTVYVTYPLPETFAYWAEFNSCEAKAEVTELPELGESPGTRVRVLDVECSPDVSVVLYAIIGGGHNWPGHEPGFPRSIAGEVNFDIDATAVIWDFFAQHQRTPPTAD